MVTGLASLSYARPPAPVTAPIFSAISLGEATGSALQQDDQKPKDTPSNPGRDEQKPKDSKPADAAKPAKPQEPDKAQSPKPQDVKPDKNQAKQDKKDQDKRDQAQKDQAQKDQAQKDQAQKDQNQKDVNQNHSQDRNQANRDQNQAGSRQGSSRQGSSRQGSSRQVSDSDRKAHFGQEHRFSVKQVVTTTRIVPNQTRFVYTGYTFVIADPWPDDWAMDDDCYIDYVDGEYFLFDATHPGVRIALTIVG
jgi:type IV secretory pathway VirB10-like protein